MVEIAGGLLNVFFVQIDMLFLFESRSNEEGTIFWIDLFVVTTSCFVIQMTLGYLYKPNLLADWLEFSMEDVDTQVLDILQELL